MGFPIEEQAHTTSALKGRVVWSTAKTQTRISRRKKGNRKEKTDRQGEVVGETREES